MQRRRYLAAVVASAVATAGCSVLGGSETKSVAKEYLRAFYADDDERMLELAHPDSPEHSRLQGNTGDALHSLESMDASVIREDGDTVIVKIDFRDTSGEDSRDAEFELRKHDGEWRVWDFI